MYKINVIIMENLRGFFLNFTYLKFIWKNKKNEL